MKTLYIKNYGCQMNAYDAGRMADLLGKSHGMTPVAHPHEADLIILNTCHIREKAEEKIFSELGRLHKMVRQERPPRTVYFAVGGCVGQAEGAQLFKRAPFVDLVFGPQNYHQLPQMLDQILAGERQRYDIDIPPDSKFDTLPPTNRAGPTAAVPVQEGCDRFCTYCVVPFTRGREWSRSVEEILAEIRNVVNKGAVEIELLGQNVNAYRGQDAAGVEHDLALLIRQAALVAGVQRLRFVTSHPADMNQDLVDVFAEIPELAPYMHLPVQSGSDTILAAMNRGHSVADYLDWIDRLRAARPDIALASDFIVGFPGESPEDFQNTLDLVRTVRYDHAYSFVFSPRPGTAAADMEGEIPKEEAESRLQTLQTLINTVQYEKNQERIGQIERVLVEGPAKRGNGLMAGRCGRFRRINFPAPATLVGRMVNVLITEARPNSLIGVWQP